MDDYGMYANSVIQLTESLSDIFDDLSDRVGEKIDDGITLDGAIDALSNATAKADSQLKDPNSILNQFIGTDAKKSIIGRARNSVLQFPVFISTNINIDIAQILSKAFERMYADYTQSALSLSPTISSGEENNGKFLRRFHNNITEAMKIIEEYHADDIDSFDEIMKESVFNIIATEDRLGMVLATKPSSYIIKESARQARDVHDGLKHYFREGNNTPAPPSKVYPIADYASGIVDSIPSFRNPPKDPGREPIKKLTDNQQSFDQAHQRWEDEHNEYIDFQHRHAAAVDRAIQDMQTIINKYNGDPAAYAQDLTTQGNTAEAQRISASYKKFPNGTFIRDGRIHIGNGTYTTDGSGNVVDSRKGSVTSTAPQVRAPELNRSNEYKKINSMSPYTLTASFRIKNADGTYNPTPVSFVIGVKSILHPVDANQLVDDMDDLITGRDDKLQKVRYKTGELKMKDYIFQISRAKRDAMNKVNGKWTTNLKRLASSNPSQIDDVNFIPNATLILTNSDVNEIKGATGYDLNSIGLVKRLAANMFLICFGIVDPSAGTLKVFMPDIDSTWDVQSLASISTEVNRLQNTDMSRELQRIIMGR